MTYVRQRPKSTLMLDIDSSRRLSRRVRAWAILHQVTMNEIAAAMRVTKWHLSRTGNGDAAMSVELAMDLCALTGLDIDGDDVPGPPRQALQPFHPG